MIGPPELRGFPAPGSVPKLGQSCTPTVRRTNHGCLLGRALEGQRSEAYKRYTDQIPGIMQKFGGKILARGGKFKILEGPEKFARFNRHRVLEPRAGGRLPRLARYQAAAEHRKKNGAGEVELVIVESMPT